MESSPIFQGKLLLQLLIVDNHKTLLQAIISLDPFPNDDCFKQLSTIHRRLKYADGPFTLTQVLKLLCPFLIAQWFYIHNKMKIQKYQFQNINHRNRDKINTPNTHIQSQALQ